MPGVCCLARKVIVAAAGVIAAVLAAGVFRRLFRGAGTDAHTKMLEELKRTKRLDRVQAALRRVEQRLAALSESLPFGMWELDSSGTQVLKMSESYCRLFGMSMDEIMQGGWSERVPPDDAERFLAAWNPPEGADTIESEYRVHAVNGKTYWILSRGRRLTGPSDTSGWVGFSLDITERKRSEERIGLLSELGRVLSLSLEPRPILERAAQLLVPRIADWCTIDLVTSDQSINRALILHRDPEHTRVAYGLPDGAHFQPLFGSASAQVIASRQGVLMRSATPEEGNGVELSDKQRAVAAAFKAESALILPLIARDQTVGAITVAANDPWRRYDSDDLDFVSIIARRIALAFDNALLYDRERRVADTFQRASLPERLPNIPGITIRAHYTPGANEALVGGDWYDAFQLADGRIGLSIGDVAGKGLQAASIMSTVRLLIRAVALEGAAPSLVLGRANALLINDKPTMVTAIFGVLDPEELTFRCSVAGHPPPIVVNADGDLTCGIPVAPPLGVSSDVAFPEQTLMLPLGSLMALYTDGLIEGGRESRLGEAGLVESVRSVAARHMNNPAEEIAKSTVGVSPSDDVAILTVQAAEKPLLELDLTLPAQPVSGRLFRQALRRLYLAAGLNEDAIGLLQVAIGEAITNSIQHAYGVQGGAVRVKGRVDAGKLVVDIADSGRWRDPHDDGGGFGLQILKSIVSDVTIDTDEQGTTVHFVHPIGRIIA